MKKILFNLVLIFGVAYAHKINATVFYSQSSGNFSNVNNWNTLANGTGASAVAGDLTSGTHVFIVKNSQTVYIDQDITVDGLIVGQGSGTTVLEIKGGTDKIINVVSTLYVDANGDFRLENVNNNHQLNITGNTPIITNLRFLNLRRSATSFVNTTYTGLGTLTIAGNATINFSGLTANNGGTITTSGTITAAGTLGLSNNSTLTGTATFYARENVSVQAGSKILFNNGSFIMDQASTQTLSNNGTCQFFRFYIDNGSKTILGKISVENLLRVYNDAVFIGSDSVIISKDLMIENEFGWVGTGGIRFNAPSTSQGTISTNGNISFTLALGTADVIIDGYMQIANNTDLSLDGDLTIKDNSRLIINETASLWDVSYTNTFSIGASSLLYIRGASNYPDFGSYSFSETSRTFYDAALATVPVQLVLGGVAYGDLIVTNGTKNAIGGAIDVNGAMTVSGGTFFTLVGFDLKIGGSVNGTGGTLDCRGTVFLDGIDRNQTLSNNVTYIFNNFVVQNAGPLTAIRTKTIANDIRVKGNMTLTNTAGDASNYMIVNLGAFNINGLNAASSGPAGIFTVNDNVRLYTSSATGFSGMFDGILPNFTSVSLSPLSTIQFDGGVAQTVPALTYGNLTFRGNGNKTLAGNVSILKNVDGNGGGYVLNDAGFTISAFGDWNMGDFGNGFNRTAALTGNFIFAGADQTCNESAFNNVSFSGSGTKTLNFNMRAKCNMTVATGVTVVSGYNMQVGCDLLTSGSGKLQQSSGIFYLDGTVNQNVTFATPSTTFLSELRITNNTSVIKFNSNVDINGQLTLNSNTAKTLDIQNVTVNIAGDFYTYANNNMLLTGSTLVFDGASDQNIQNGKASFTYNNIEFRNSGEKRLNTNVFDINGNVICDLGVTLTQNQQLNVAGNWSCLGSISGSTGNVILFDGVNQAINGTDFNTVHFGGTGVKTLGSNILVKGALYILSNSTLDVGANRKITVNGNWYNDLGGSFNSNTGTVEFSSINNNIYTGGDANNKAFYNLNISLSSIADVLSIGTVRTAAIDPGTNLKVKNNFNVIKGVFQPGASNVLVGGNLYTHPLDGWYNGSNSSHELYFVAGLATKTWTSRPIDLFGRVYVDAIGQTLKLTSDVFLTSGRNIIINNGTFDLNTFDISFSGTSRSDVLINGTAAEFKINEGAVLSLPNNNGSRISNNNGIFRIVGVPGNNAIATSINSFLYVQTGANSLISARYYSISNTNTNGFDIQDGKIDAVNNFSDGTFTNGLNTCYLKMYSDVFLSPSTIKDVIFNGGPTYNAVHTSGVVITFQDAKGSHSGPARELDDVTTPSSALTGKILWTYLNALFWDGEAGTLEWNNPVNWTGNTLPNDGIDVILDHSRQILPASLAAYNLQVTGISAKTKSLSILNSGGTAITLTLNTMPLVVKGDLSIGGVGRTINQTNPAGLDTIYVAGSYSISTSAVLGQNTNSNFVFNGASGSYTISTNSAANNNTDLNHVFFRGNASYTLVDVLEIEGNLTMTGSSLGLGDANNSIQLKKNVTISDLGSFKHSNATVKLNGNALDNQLLDFGGQAIYHLSIEGASTKQLNSSLSVSGNFTFVNGTGIFTAGNVPIFVYGSWYNAANSKAFNQTGNGYVVFGSQLTQNIGTGTNVKTTFKNLIFRSSGTKNINTSIIITGDLSILMEKNVNQVVAKDTVSIIGGGASSKFLMEEGVFILKGANQFPSSFGTTDLVGGEIRYESSGINQNIAGVSYYDLRFYERIAAFPSRRIAQGNIEIKNRYSNYSSGSTYNPVVLDMNCYSLKIGSLITVDGLTPQIDWGTACKTTCGTGGTLIVGAVNNIPSQMTNFHNLRIENNGVLTTTLNRNISVEGDLLISDASILDMASYRIKNTCSDVPNSSSFYLGNSSNLRTSVAIADSTFPIGFGSYSLANSSLVEYRLNGSQKVYTKNGTIVYGNLDLEGGNTKTLEGKLFVDGIFDMNNNTTLVDAGFDMEFGGSLVDFGAYTATNNYTLFKGLDQTIRIDHTSNAISLNEARFEGIGTKRFWDAETYNFTKNFKVAADVIIDFKTYNQNISFAGDSILVKGTLLENGDGNLFRFNKIGAQVADLGASHDIGHLDVKTGSQLSIINNGLNVTESGGSNNNFVRVEAGAILNLDTLTHKIAQDNFVVLGTLNASNANIIFNRAGNQLIDKFIAKDVTFTGSGTKNMNGIWRMNDILIDGGVNVNFNNQDTVVVRGNWESTGGLLNSSAKRGVVLFEIDDSNPRTINPNGAIFPQMKFAKIGVNAATYSMLGNLSIDDSLRVNSGANLVMNGNILYLGLPVDGAAQDESLVIESGATLNLDAGSSLLFDGNGTVDANIDVYGHLIMLGSPSAITTITRNGGGRKIDIDVLGGKISARYYDLSFLTDGGLFVNSSATIDPVNNFSDGIFSQLREGVGANYLQVEADVTGVNSIRNVSFNGVNPVVGLNYNVVRNRTDGGVLTFDDVISGSFGGYTFEKETVTPTSIAGRIVWPLSTITNWIGGDVAGVSDWFVSANWSNGVPDTSKTAVIGVRPFMPVIGVGLAAATDTAKCKNLKLTANSSSLILKDGVDLLVKSDLQLGTGNLSTSLSVQNANSHIIVGGNWFKTVNSYFTHGNSTVKFLTTSSVVNIQHNDNDELEAFYNVVFQGSYPLNIIGDMNINGSVTQVSGTVYPKTNNYNIWVAGNWDGSGGTFNTSINGTVTFDGGAQTLTNSNFDNLTFAGTGCKTIVGALKVNDFFYIDNCLIASAASAIDMNGDVEVTPSGSFNDGGQIHTFSGVNWTGTGSFPLNTGTINFDRLGGIQYINASKFNNLNILSTSQIQFLGNINVTKSVTVNNSINSLYTNGFLLQNTTGVGDFFLGASENIYVNGADNFPKGFGTYSLAPNSNTRYNGTGSQSVRGGLDYGNLILTNISTKTIISGAIGIKGDLTITGSTLDVSPSNYGVNISGNWNNNAAGSFVSRNGTVTFNGSGVQAVNAGDHITDGIKSFYNILVNNTSAASPSVDVNGSDIYVNNNLQVIDGIFGLDGVSGGWNAYVGGDLNASAGGGFTNTGTFYLKSTKNSILTGNLIIAGNGSILNNIVIDPTTANAYYQLNSDLIVNGNFDLLQGRLYYNGRTASLGTDINDRVTVAGAMYLNAGSELKLGNQTSLTVASPSGLFSIIGTTSNPALVSRRYGFGDYNFTVNGNIAAQYYGFEGMSAQGIFISNTGLIDNVNNFSNGSFSNTVNASVAIRIENTQKFTTFNGRRIENVSFTNNPSGGTINAMKTVATSDSVEFYNAKGVLSGEAFENDPGNMIFWTGPRKMVWTGAKNSDWYNVLNWSSTSGPVQVPDQTLDAIIPLVINQPVINVAGAKAKNLTVMSGAFLTLATADNTGSDLIVYEELLFEGILTTSSSSDIIEVRGDWSKVGSGNYTFGTGGKVVFAKDNGSLNLNNGGASFYDVEINAVNGSVFLKSNLTLQNNLVITNGTLDIGGSNFTISIKGNFVNNGVFKERNGTVILATPNPITLNTQNTSFYKLTKTGVGLITMSTDLRVKDIFELSSGTLNLVNKILYMGDASGSDNLKISGGTLISGANSEIRMSDNASVNISLGGKLQLLGTSLSQRAKITNQSGSTKYAFVVSFGGSLDAKYYNIENLDKNGIQFQSGSTLGATNNLSYGTLRNGTTGGVYLNFNNSQDLTGNNQIEYVEFATNPGGGAYNVKKTLNSGIVKFYYAFGPFQGEDFENDPYSKVFWDADMIWTGAVSSNWSDPLNWTPALKDVSITTLLPTSLTDVVIRNSSLTNGRSPILNVNGLASDLEILAGGVLNIGGGFNLSVVDSIIIAGTVNVANGSASTLSLGGSWVSDGTGVFNSGNASIVQFNGTKGNQYVTSDDGFCQFTINKTSSSNYDVRTVSPLDINCDLVIQNGVLSVQDVTHTILLSGNWINYRTATNTGFNNIVGAEVIFDGNTDKTITKSGSISELFNKLTISKTGGAKVLLNSNVILNSDLTISNGAILDLNSKTIDLNANWINLNTSSAVGLVSGSGTALFSGAVAQTISHVGGQETFYNLTLNNPLAGSALILASDASIANNFVQSDGIVATGTNNLILLSTIPAKYTGYNSSQFVFGNLRRYVASNTLTYPFPVGRSTSSANYYPMDIINNNLVTTSYITVSVKSIVEGGDNVDSKLNLPVPVLDNNNTSNPFTNVYGDVAIWSMVPNVQPTGGSYGTKVYLTNINMSGKDDLFGLLKRPDGSTSYADWTDGYPNTSLPALGQPGRVYAGGAGFAIRSGWKSFSELVPAVADKPLPITLLSFTASHLEGVNLLSWITQSEINNDYFTVEKSFNGVDWVVLGTLSGAGTTNEMIQYNMTDVSPYLPVTYYRLKQVDYNRTVNYSNVITVQMTKATIAQVYPNPTVGDYVHLYLPDSEEVASISVTDMLGREVQDVELTKNGSTDLTTLAFKNRLETGQFVVNVIYNDGTSKKLKFTSL